MTYQLNRTRGTATTHELSVPVADLGGLRRFDASRELSFLLHRATILMGWHRQSIADQAQWINIKLHKHFLHMSVSMLHVLLL